MPRGRSYSKKVSFKKKTKSRKIKKKALVKARQSVVETKRKVFEPQLPLTYNELTSKLSVMVPDAWEKQSQGYRDDDMVGSSIFMKYLTAKFHFDFNHEDIVKVPIPVDLRFIIGWCKLPQNIAPQATAETGPPAMVKDVVYNYNPEQHIAQYLSHNIDNPLEAIDRTIFKVDRDFRVQGNPRTAVQGLEAAGYVPKYTRKNFYLSHTWRPMRKLKCELVTSNSSGNGEFFSPCNKDGQWIPFIAVYNVNYQTFPGATATGGDARCPMYITKSTSYFTDS